MSKIELRMSDFTPNEIVAANRAVGRPMAEVPQEEFVLFTAALVWVYERRTDPDVTYAQVCDRPIMRDYVVVPEDDESGDDHPEARSGGNGGAPLSSLAPGG